MSTTSELGDHLGWRKKKSNPEQNEKKKREIFHTSPLSTLPLARRRPLSIVFSHLAERPTPHRSSISSYRPERSDHVLEARTSIAEPR